MSTVPASHGLSTQDVETIRAGLAAGRRPKVVFTSAAGQIAGQLGQVVALTDPDGSDDFLVVRFGRDELPFSPDDLRIAPKSPPRKAPAAASAGPDPSEETVTMPTPVPDAQPSPTETAGGASAPASADAGSGAPTAPAAESAAGAGNAPPAPAGGVPSPRKAARATKQARPRPPAALTVTLSYADGEWLVAAEQGTKVLAKPYLVRPAEALKMVGMLDVPGVIDAVEQIVAAEREQARAQAQQLRAQLAEVEAKLAELGDAAGGGLDGHG